MTTPTTATEWRTTSVPPVPMARFGKDHWSTFAYIETRIVDYRGKLAADSMRCDRDRHPGLHSVRHHSAGYGDRKYPTRLKTEQPNPTLPGAAPRWGLVEIADHDDYDCVDDLIAAGLLVADMPTWDPSSRNYIDGNGLYVTSDHTGGVDWRYTPDDGIRDQVLMAAAVFRLTDTGKAVAGQLRAWKGERHNFHQFEASLREAEL